LGFNIDELNEFNFSNLVVQQLNKSIGVMVVQDYSDPATYGPAQQQMLDVISYPISRAIERKMVEEERE
jgi:hypothetical protein